jgi:hypothetical protein
MMRGRPWRWLVLSVAIATGGALGATAASAQPTGPTAGISSAKSQACITGRVLCTEVQDYYHAYGGKYVGHDEPSVLYYSNVPGAGNSNSWQVTLPKDPPPSVKPGRSWSFQLTPAFWFGMAMCDTQSYPQVTNTCSPDSDSNITPLAQHPGTAFMELQFYPPGWVKQFAGSSCDPKAWCAAMNIDSLSEDPIHGTMLNTACQNQVLGGTEYVNFAFITRSGTPIGPPNPLQFDPATSGNPTRPDVLFMQPGDRISVSLHDTAQGLQAVLVDLKNHKVGSMTASAANGFGQIQAAPTGTSCTETPYNFHPMYSTSSPQTRVPWAAHSYNIAFDEEIGHFDYCTAVDANGNCTGQEGAPGDQEATDGDDVGCFPATAALLVKVTGCTGTNVPGWDGTSYLPLWPDGNTTLHPTPGLFSSPLTGPSFNTNYSTALFESDTPRNEDPQFGPFGMCNRTTGADCTIVPTTDDNQPATFYPFYSITSSHGSRGCQWFIGNQVPGLTANDFGGVSQYGTLFPQDFLIFGGGGTTHKVIDDFQNNLGTNPCPA